MLVSERVLTWLYIQDPHCHVYSSYINFLYNIQFTFTILQWMYLSTKYFNISTAYTTSGRYIGIRAFLWVYEPCLLHWYQSYVWFGLWPSTYRQLCCRHDLSVLLHQSWRFSIPPDSPSSLWPLNIYIYIYKKKKKRKKTQKKKIYKKKKIYIYIKKI